MNTTSLREKPPPSRASRIQSSIGRPMTGTSVLGTSSVRGPSREPRPAPMMIGRIAAGFVAHRPPAFNRRSGGASVPDAMTLDLTLGFVTDLHFGPEARFDGKLRKLTHHAGALTAAAVEALDRAGVDALVNLG